MRLAPGLEPPPPAASLARDPWRLFFPLGALLAWAGVLHWLLYAVGATQEYRAVFHATAQIQGFLTCIAAGFLFTFVPRRTGTAPASLRELAAAAAGPVLATVAAFGERWALAQALWLAGVLVVAAFVVRRLLSPGASRRVPAVFLWVPVGLAAGAGGAALVAVAAVLGPGEEPALWLLGRGALLQGMVTALVVGVGGTMLPVLTRGSQPPEPGPGGGWLVQAAAALLFFASFPLEAYGAPRSGLALRALFLLATLAWAGLVLPAIRAAGPPAAPGS